MHLKLLLMLYLLIKIIYLHHQFYTHQNNFNPHYPIPRRENYKTINQSTKRIETN